MKRIKTLLVLSLGLMPKTYFGQALIKNFEYFSILNPAAAASRDSLAITTAHNYYDSNSSIFQNASLGGIEFELPRINSGFAFHTSFNRVNRVFLSDVQIQALAIMLSYRYTLEFSENMDLSLGLSAKRMSRNYFFKYPQFWWSQGPTVLEDNLWSMNAGLLWRWHDWHVGLAVHDVLEPKFLYFDGYLEDEEPVLRGYHFHTAYDLKFSQKFSLRPQLYFSRTSTMSGVAQRLHFRHVYFSTEFLYLQKFYFSPGIRSMMSSLPDDYRTFSFSMNLGWVFMRRLQLGIGVEHYSGISQSREIAVEGMLKYRLRK